MSDTPHPAHPPRQWLPPALSALVFALLSLAILPYPGLQDDEVIFTAPIYQPTGTLFSVKAFGTHIPLMIIGYLGTLKTWLYAAILTFIPPSRWSVRLPMVMVGMITICLTWQWTRRVAGLRAAAFTVALLATHSIFILTNTFDWGPVALQHLLLMGGLLAIQCWLESDAKWQLALGFFLWGLGLWDKALLIWPLIGLAAATLCVYPRQLRAHLRRVPPALALAALLLGALPLVSYNVARRGDTAAANTRLTFREIPRKLLELQNTLDGSVLLDAMVATTPGPLAQPADRLPERASISLRNITGSWPSNWMLAATVLALAILALPGTSAHRPLLAFLLIVIAVTWLQMASNAGTGGGAHHVILLWPFPSVFVGIALAAAAEGKPRWMPRASLGVLTALVCVNLLNTNDYVANLALNGAVGGWTDAFYRLAGAVAPYRSRPIGIVDWGYLNGLRMMYDGDLNATVMSDYLLNPHSSDEDRSQFTKRLNAPDAIFIRHTDENEIFKGVNEKMRTQESSLGLTEKVERVVHDNEGRQIFEIFTLSPIEKR